MADCDFMSGPVIFDNQRMVHGDIRRALFKITYGITAGGHHVAEQPVGLAYGTFGVINKLRLNLAPGCDIALPVSSCERMDCETLDAFFSRLQPGFPLPSAPAFLDDAGIFRSESSAQFSCFALSEKNHCSDS